VQTRESMDILAKLAGQGTCRGLRCRVVGDLTCTSDDNFGERIIAEEWSKGSGSLK